MRAALSAAGVICAVLAGEPVAGATVACQSTLPQAGALLGRIDGETRLAWIDARLSEAARTTRLWTWGWGGGIAVSGVASLAVVPLVRREERIDWYTSAVSAAIGVIPFLLSPLDVTRDAAELHKAVITMSAGALPNDVCALLSDAERRLVADADNQRRQQSWWLHLGNLAFNGGVALFLGLGYQHWGAGIINGVAGAAVGEAIILTQPTRTIDDLRTYRAGLLMSGYSGAF